MKPRGFTVLQLLGVLVVVLILAAILFPVFQRAREPHRPGSCQSSLKQISLGFQQYIQDYDEEYPLVAINNLHITANHPYGWADVIQPYIKSTWIYHCPSDKTPAPTKPDPTQSGYTDYWCNSNLSGVSQKKLISVMNTVLAGDGNDGIEVTDARYSKFGLPANWLTDKSKPSLRHLDGANYAFADGHVKWLKPEQVSTIDRPKGKNYTFAIK